MKQLITISLTKREHRHLLRQRGKQRSRQILNSACSPLFSYWFAWICSRDEWQHIRCGKWQQETVRKAVRSRLRDIRLLREQQLAPLLAKAFA